MSDLPYPRECAAPVAVGILPAGDSHLRADQSTIQSGVGIAAPDVKPVARDTARFGAVDFRPPLPQINLTTIVPLRV